MKIIECAQGSPEWLQARCGVITASMFAVARSRVGGLTDQQAVYVNAIVAGETQAAARELAGYKRAPSAEAIERALAGLPVGDFSDAAKDYAFRLAVERISGEPLDEGFQTFAMRRGHELEPAARLAHELSTGLAVKRCGFILTDDEAFGCSADGLIGDDGGSEYKCLIDPARVRQVLLDNDVSEFIDQVQGCAWITGRAFWHFGLYCPALQAIGKDLWWREFRRDDDYIEAMERDLIAFKELVDQNEARLRNDVKVAA